MKRNFHVQISQRGARDNTLPRLYQLKGKQNQFRAIDEAIRTGQFIRNKALRYWMDRRGISKYDLNKYCAVLAKEFDFASRLNSTARQSSAERAWSSISKFYTNCKRSPLTPLAKGGKEGGIGYPKYKKHSRTVEYKKSGWKLDPTTKKHITFKDKNNIGRLKLVGSRDIYFYQPEQIQRVRLVRRSDGYYVQFCVSVEVKENVEPSGKAIGLDMGLKYFICDSFGNTEENPRFYRNAEKKLNRLNRKKSVKYSKKRKRNKFRQSNNYHKARKRYAIAHLKISRQRKDHAVLYVIQRIRCIHSKALTA